MRTGAVHVAAWGFAFLLICVLPLLIAASVWERPQHRQAMLLLATLGIVALVALTGSYGLWWLPAVTIVVLAAILLIRRLRRKTGHDDCIRAQCRLRIPQRHHGRPKVCDHPDQGCARKRVSRLFGPP